MRQSWWGVGARRHDLRRGLLRELLALDDHLDVILLPPSLFAIAPPHRSLVIALQSQILAC